MDWQVTDRDLVQSNILKRIDGITGVQSTAVSLPPASGLESHFGVADIHVVNKPGNNKEN